MGIEGKGGLMRIIPESRFFVTGWLRSGISRERIGNAEHPTTERPTTTKDSMSSEPVIQRNSLGMGIG